MPRTQVSSSSPTATPFSPTSTPVTGPTATPIALSAQSSSSSPTLSFVLGQFAHGQMGKSEIYLDVEVTAGNSVTATLSGPGITSSTVQTVVAGTGGEVRLIWTIDQFGEYSITGTAGPTPISGSVTVE